MIWATMKNAASLFKFVYISTKIGLFIYFFQDFFKLIS